MGLFSYLVQYLNFHLPNFQFFQEREHTAKQNQLFKILDTLKSLRGTL